MQLDDRLHLNKHVRKTAGVVAYAQESNHYITNKRSSSLKYVLIILITCHTLINSVLFLFLNDIEIF